MVSRSSRRAGAGSAGSCAGWRRTAAYVLGPALLGVTPGAHAAEQGALGAVSRAAIRIEASVAPRLSYEQPALAPGANGQSAQLVLRCAYLNTRTALFSLIAPGEGNAEVPDQSAPDQSAPGQSAPGQSAPTPAAPASSLAAAACLRGSDQRWQVTLRGGAALTGSAQVFLLAPL